MSGEAAVSAAASLCRFSEGGNSVAREADWQTMLSPECLFSHKQSNWFTFRMRRVDEGGAVFRDERTVVFMTERDKRAPSDDESARVGKHSLFSPAGDMGEVAGEQTKALEEMLPQVYEELRMLAGGYLRHERPEHTLQRTALVHEAYLRLAAQGQVAWENPAHLLAIFARLMRQTLTNHAVARTRAKRGGTDPTEVILEFYERHQIDVAAVDEALRELEAFDPRQAQIVELRFFAGLTIDEIATLMAISPATVKREWAVAKLWLRRSLMECA